MFEVDAVITWVDGSDPALKQKRDKYLTQAATPLHVNGTNPHRWVCSDELNFCVRSIANHAPWVRRIWIVTDSQIPVLASLPDDFAAKISIVDHREIFTGHEDALPTFNSLSIETMLWRIPELSEHFLYFNDDVFLTAPLAPADVFAGMAPVLRGKWVDRRVLAADVDARRDPALLHDFAQINAAAMLGFGPQRVFAAAHVVHPMRRSVFARLWEAHGAAFVANIGHRFRDVGQFSPQGLHNHASIAAGEWVMATADDHLHVRTGAVADYPVAEVRAYLRRALRPEIKFLCVNDLPQVEAVIPETRDWISAAVGGERRAA